MQAHLVFYRFFDQSHIFVGIMGARFDCIRIWICVNLYPGQTQRNPISTTSPTGASLSDIFRQLLPWGLLNLTSCFHLFWKDILSAMYVDWGPPHLSLEVLCISPTDTSSMQNLILEGLQQKLQKSCSRCNKNTRHVESSYILQPPKYLLLFVNRFRYINNNIT